LLQSNVYPIQDVVGRGCNQGKSCIMRRAG
jgi:hypothetical protein